MNPAVMAALRRNGIATPHLAPSFNPDALQGKKETGVLMKVVQSALGKTLNKAMSKRAVMPGRVIKHAAKPKRGSHVTIPSNHFL